jgi:protein-tyrosine phosphatase
MTALERKHFDWEGCFNARDLGGLPTRDGRVTSHGVFLRGDTLCDLTEDGRRSLREDGVRTIVDLRGLDELEREPNPFAAIDGIRYEHRPLNDPGVTSRISVIEDSTERYRVMLDGNGQRIAAIMNVIATSPRAVLFHCFAGRDRTGIIAAVLLRLAGVADEAIVEDYAISDERLVTRYDQWRAKQNEVQRARMEQSIAEADATIRGTLDHLDAKHGGVEAYLLKHGLDPAAIGRLKNDLIG